MGRLILCGKCHRLGYLIMDNGERYDFDLPWSNAFDGWYQHKKLCYKEYPDRLGAKNGEPTDSDGAIEILFR